ncbi:hypothetical protein HQ520_11050 [bacterium]|nr:hypothetical protein [bacterium]
MGRHAVKDLLCFRKEIWDGFLLSRGMRWSALRGLDGAPTDLDDIEHFILEETDNLWCQVDMDTFIREIDRRLKGRQFLVRRHFDYMGTALIRTIICPEERLRKARLAIGLELYRLWGVGPDRTNENGDVKYDPTNGTLSAGDLF